MDNCPECGTTMTFSINGDWHIIECPECGHVDRMRAFNKKICPKCGRYMIYDVVGNFYFSDCTECGYKETGCLLV